MFRVDVAFNTFLSIDSTRSFRRVGHGVGQALRIRLLEVKLALRHPDHKIMLQPGRFGGDNVIPLKHCPRIGKIFLVLLGQRSDPSLFAADGLRP